jgi:hypothetical protein
VEGFAAVVNATDSDGKTALQDACRSGRPESVRLLLDAGAKFDRTAGAHEIGLQLRTDFSNEDNLWTRLRNEAAAPDEFRPHAVKSDEDTGSQRGIERLQHDTARVGPIASMLLEADVHVKGNWSC